MAKSKSNTNYKIPSTSRHPKKIRTTQESRRREQRVPFRLSPGSALLGHLPLLSVLLLLQELLLLLGVHFAESAVALFLLELLGLHTALLGFLLVVELAQLARLVFTSGADLAQSFGAEVGGADEVVGHAQESGEEGGRGGLGVEAHREVDALAGDEVVESVRSLLVVILKASMGFTSVYVLLGGIDRLVGNDQCLEVLTGIRDSLDKFGSKHCLGDLGALAHDGGPVRKLGVVLGSGQRNVVALVTKAPHLVLVHNSKDETIVGGVFASGRGGKQSLLLAVEAVRGGLDPLNGIGHAVGEEGHGSLAEPRKGVVALVQGDLDVQPRDVLPSSAVSDVLALALLLQHILGNLSATRQREALLLGIGHASILAVVETNACVLAIEHGQVSGSPFLRASAVCAGADDVDKDNDQDHGNDNKLLVEVGETRALPNAVPRGVRAVRIQVRGGSLGGSCSARGDRRCRVRRCQRRGCCREVGEVYVCQCQCAAASKDWLDRSLTSIARQGRRDGRGASEETFDKVRHVVDAWGGAEAKWESEPTIDEGPWEQRGPVELPQHNRTSGAILNLADAGPSRALSERARLLDLIRACDGEGCLGCGRRLSDARTVQT